MARAFTSFLDRLNDRRPGPLSLERAFSAQGVTLTDPRSWSGIRVKHFDYDITYTNPFLLADKGDRVHMFMRGGNVGMAV